MKNESVLGNVAASLQALGCSLMLTPLLLAMLACIGVILYATAPLALEGDPMSVGIWGTTIVIGIVIFSVVRGAVQGTNERNAAKSEAVSKQEVLDKQHEARFQQTMASIRATKVSKKDKGL